MTNRLRSTSITTHALNTGCFHAPLVGGVLVGERASDAPLASDQTSSPSTSAPLSPPVPKTLPQSCSQPSSQTLTNTGLATISDRGAERGRNHLFLIDRETIRESVIGMNSTTTKRAAFYVRVSTSDGQTTENQLRHLHEVAQRSGWTVVAIFNDEGISGTKGRDRRPGLDALMKGVARREFDIVAAWSVDRLGRSLPDLVTLLGDLQARGVDIFLHQQALDTSTPSGKMLFQMLGVFAEFERSMIVARVRAGLQRTTKRLGRPPMPEDKVEGIKAMLAQGLGVRETARRTGAGTATVQRLKRAMTVEGGEETVAA